MPVDEPAQPVMRSQLHFVTAPSLRSSSPASSIEAADRISLAELFCGVRPLHFSETWVAQEKAGQGMDRQQEYLLDTALGILKGASILPLNLALHDQGGRFEFTLREAARHVRYAVIFTRDPNDPSVLGHLAVHKVSGTQQDTQKPIVQIGSDDVGSTRDDGDDPASGRASSRGGSQLSPSVTSSPGAARSRTSSARSHAGRLESDSPELDRAFEEEAEAAFRELHAGRATPEYGDSDSVTARAGWKRRAGSPVGEAAAKRPLLAPDTGLQASGSIQGPSTEFIDMTGDSPAPSASAGAHTDEAPVIQNLPLSADRKRAFLGARNKCLAELVKYFSNEELAGMAWDTADIEVENRAVACLAVPADKEKLLKSLRSWLQQLHDTIPDTGAESQLLLEPDGKQMTVANIAYYRASRGNNIEPLKIHPPANPEQYRANSDALKRFQSNIRESLGLDEGAGRVRIRQRSDQRTAAGYAYAATIADWATRRGLDLTTVAPHETHDYRMRFSRDSEASMYNRFLYSEPFFNFLAEEYTKRRQAPGAGSQEQGSASGTEGRQALPDDGPE